MKQLRFLVVYLLAAFLFMLLAPLASAQSYRARITGIVTDQTEAVIANATVTLLNVNTGIRVVRQTSDTGLYLFDLVDPGTYTITVEASGFSRFVQENIVVQARGDITVNAMLRPGAIQDSITVVESPVAVQFNSANKDFTLDSTMAQEIPRLDRNPFKLTLIAPSAINTRSEMMPYHSWAANSVDLGGGTNLKNDLQVDGSPVGLGHKNSYPPNTDAVQEVVVSQNPVDAESGHSAGGLISLTLKSGTNDWHGSAFYLGRYPWANAESDRTRFTQVATRQHMGGGTLGNAIIKNKLFNFFSLEYWKVGQPGSYTTTVPTALEREGDFSKTFHIDGGLKTIYDPYTTEFDPTTNTVSRQPFPGNVIPKSRFDPLSAALVKDFWDPNNPGDNITGVNNYKQGYSESYIYYNFLDRVDYNVNEKWKVNGRFGRYHTDNLQPNMTPNKSQLFVPTGTLRAAHQVSGDVIWTVNPRTVVNIHGAWHKVIDAYVSESMGDEGWAKLWPNNPWYKDYQEASRGVPVYFPLLNIGGTSFGGRGFYWDQKPQGQAYSAKISQQRGSHYLKAGIEHRRGYGVTFVGNTSQFFFPTELTAETFISPDVKHNGFGFATFLLGALDGQTQMIGGPAPDPHMEFYGMFIQDDWKVNRWLTLNIGLRNEYETPWYDPGHNMSQGLDLSAPVPEMMANPPNMPQAALALVGNDYYKWNGMWKWTSDEHPGMWDAQKLALSPRLGAAFRITDRTALRVGYGRFLVPYELMVNQAPVSGFETVSFLEPPYFGVKGYQNTIGLLEGIPQQTFSDPYPASKNPLLPIDGKQAGSNVGRGGAPLLWYPQKLKKARNDRINVNLQHQFPLEIVGSVTWLMNIGNQHYTKALNNTDPRILEAQQSAVNVEIENPFYEYLDPTVFPGPLRNQRVVTLSSLLKRYPHYGGLYEVGTLGAKERYHSIELKAQRPFTQGWNFVASYVYIREKTQVNDLNELDTYLNRLEYLNSNQPRHRMTVAGTYNLPFGKNRPLLNTMPRVAEAIIGGWKITGLSTYMSGAILRFGKMNYDGSRVTVDNPRPERWFNTSAFSPIPANTYVIRSNPRQFDDLTGPSYWMLDGTLSKVFSITERVQTEFTMKAYNAINRLNRGNPNMSVTSSQFGQALYQGTPSATFGPQTMELGNVSGRQIELGMKITF
ncbi:MAG TPA: carboxypeptidase-like regulatory domain-containing protein [Bryobacteraceae bacterium]|nr:carboxypeptidase-like regulatory domain-containing protein [Bryobacteraceae bacterium]HOQ45186.1 carboxypeptidase-like regulatory domain-containing protein [Bryobacteraceae bacterium]HPU71258.1 carboxypeptidase-like regulatory domain-containing protein [Bryobacteraceae bacterium]